MFVNQCIVVLSVGVAVTAGLDAATLSGLVGLSQTDSSGEAYKVSNPESPDYADFVDSSDLTPIDPTQTLTTGFCWELMTDYANYSHWCSGDMSFPYQNDIAVAAYLGAFSINPLADGSSSRGYAIYGLDRALARQQAIGESTGGGPGPGSDTPEPGTFLILFALCFAASALQIARKKALRV
jgi:hypothetical protein